MPGREGIPAVDVDLAQHVHDVSVCGIANDRTPTNRIEGRVTASQIPAHPRCRSSAGARRD
jgi:hypothetical protein